MSGRGLKKKRRDKTKRENNNPKDTISSLDSIRSSIKTETKSNTKELKSNTRMIIFGGIIAFIVLSAAFSLAIVNIPTVSTPNDSNNDSEVELIFKDLDGYNYNLAQYKGSYIILDIMATWCVPCKEQITILKQFQAEYPQVKIVSASSSDGDTAPVLTNYKNENGMTWDVVRDVYGVSQEFGISAIPTLILIDPSYNIVKQQAGVQTYGTLESWIS